MLLLAFFLICFSASTLGAVCGIGGGVIIKPVLDAFHIMDVSVISFLSGCTVLSMSTYSVIKSKTRISHIDRKNTFPLALGAAAGGLMGKWLFAAVSSLSSNMDKVGALQSLCLLIITAETMVCTLKKERIRTRHVTRRISCMTIGIFLGLLSSFLGIGGGPINLAVLFFFFSMDTKTAAENSLYIIFISQAASLLTSILSGNIPRFDPLILVLMVMGGICGGICGRAANSFLSGKTVDKLFILLMVLIIFICIYNIFVFIM